MLPGGKMLFEPEGSRRIRSLYGESEHGFICSGLGRLPMDVTICAWGKYLDFPQEDGGDGSKVLVKYGDRSSGIGLGSYVRRWPIGLVEWKYWSNTSLPLSYDWHHYALKVKTGINPLVGSVYLDGTQIVQGYGDQMNAPVNQVSFLGRAADDGTQRVLAARICIYDGLLSDSEIINNMEAGETEPIGTILHYYDGTAEGGYVRDMVGDWHLEMTQGCSIVDETPWSVGGFVIGPNKTSNPNGGGVNA